MHLLPNYKSFVYYLFGKKTTTHINKTICIVSQSSIMDSWNMHTRMPKRKTESLSPHKVRGDFGVQISSYAAHPPHTHTPNPNSQFPMRSSELRFHLPCNCWPPFCASPPPWSWGNGTRLSMTRVGACTEGRPTIAGGTGPEFRILYWEFEIWIKSGGGV